MEIAMKTASVGEIQKNFAKVINDIKAGEEIMITKRGKIIAKISERPFSYHPPAYANLNHARWAKGFNYTDNSLR
jgi:antitoxin (DNA-binding transcriptional repressor) of toxin-antitoxin stability system